MIDIHAHILPGVDDGARDFADSLEIVRELASCGVTDVIATPHFVNETIYMSPVRDNRKLLDELARLIGEADIPVNVHLGNEIYIDSSIKKLIKSHKITTMAGGDYLLVELPLNDEFPNYADYLLDLIQSGYKVILAHPERYTMIQEDYSIIDELVKMGVLLQCNLGSINGKYGKEAKKTVRKLIKDKLVFAFGSDIHRTGKVDSINMALKKLARYYNDKELETVLAKNPSKCLH